jgi:hypothetical protein
MTSSTSLLKTRPSASTHQSSLLLNLPRELRDCIWDFALSETELHIRIDDIDDHGIVIAYPDPNQQQLQNPAFEATAKNPAPRWLLTSKQLFSEGLTQFEPQRRVHTHSKT